MPRLRALIVEDSPVILENLQALLEEHGTVEVVGTAADERDACAWMDSRTQGCDVAIIDLFLQSGNGLGVLEHIARYDRPPRRIVLTNYSTDDVRSRCRALGADAVFDKSTEIEALVAWLDATRLRH